LLNVIEDVPVEPTVTICKGSIDSISFATGVYEELAVEYDPVPIIFTAATLNTYAVSIVNPVTVADVDVDVPSLNVVHDDPEFDEYCTA
jgi:hypothetical protein